MLSCRWVDGQQRHPVLHFSPEHLRALLHALFRYAVLTIQVVTLTCVTPRKEGCVGLNAASHSRLSCRLQETANANVAIVNATKATRAQPASARCLRRRVRPPTTPCATAEASARAVAVSVWRDTSVHTARRVWDVPILARLSCEDPSFCHTHSVNSTHFSANELNP